MTGLWLDREASDRLAAAKLWLISSDRSAGCPDLPYLSTALFALVPVGTDRVPTMSVDRHWRLYVNPSWLQVADIESIGRELAHLIWHLLGDHAGRAADLNVTPRTASAWKSAADASISAVVPSWTPPTGSPAALGLPPDASTEEYYAALSGLPADEDPLETADPSRLDRVGDPPESPNCGSGCDGIDRAHDLPPDADEAPALTTHGADAIRKQVAIAYREHRTTHGRIPGEWGRWVAQILEPVVPWQQVLHAAVRRGIGWAAGHTDYTYSRFSRRQSTSPHVILPALRRPIPAVAVVVDTSGSIDDGLLAQALGEVDGVLTALAIPDSGVTVLAVDAAVHSVDTVRSASAITLGGGGGTDMTVGIDAALATKPAPQVIIVLTDGYTGWPAQPLAIPVIVAVLGRSQAELPDTPSWMERVEVIPER